MARTWAPETFVPEPLHVCDEDYSEYYQPLLIMRMVLSSGMYACMTTQPCTETSTRTRRVMRMRMVAMPSDFAVIVVTTGSRAMQGLLHDLIQLPAKTPSDVGYLRQRGGRA